MAQESGHRREVSAWEVSAWEVLATTPSNQQTIIVAWPPVFGDHSLWHWGHHGHIGEVRGHIVRGNGVGVGLLGGSDMCVRSTKRASPSAASAAHQSVSLIFDSTPCGRSTIAPTTLECTPPSAGEHMMPSCSWSLASIRYVCSGVATTTTTTTTTINTIATMVKEVNKGQWVAMANPWDDEDSIQAATSNYTDLPNQARCMRGAHGSQI